MIVAQQYALHGVSEVLPGPTGGLIVRRVPSNVYQALETEDARRMCRISTGVELRFVLEGDEATVRLRTLSGIGEYQIFRGSIQGAWYDAGAFTERATEIVIRKPENADLLQRTAEECGHPFSPQVVRVILQAAEFEILGVTGTIRPPYREEMPPKTILAYGSSITHDLGGGAGQGWLARVGYRLKADTRNLGIAGHCRLEKEMVDYLAEEGRQGRWDVAILSMGANVLFWEREKIVSRVTYALRTVAEANPDKPVFAVSPIYTAGDYQGRPEPTLWRETVAAVVGELALSNVTHVNGLELLGDISLLSADEVHPGVFGMEEIANRMTEVLSRRMR